MSDKAATEIPAFMRERFENGHVPMDEPPGFEERWYAEWKAAGGKVKQKQTATEETWAILELMGHVRLAGKISEVERFGSKMGRIDIPDGEGWITQFFGGGSVYRITFVTEAVARHTAKSTAPAPVSPWDFPKQLTVYNERDEEDDDPY